MDAQVIKKWILKNLKEYKPYVYYSARTGSLYLKFEDSSLGSVRIGDHQGIEKYRYRWNIWVGQSGRCETVRDRGVDRFHFSPDNLQDFADAVRRFAG